MNSSFPHTNFDIHVRESGIHGKGIFTGKFIPEGSGILEISGEVISEDECIKREGLGNVYIFWNELNYIDVSSRDDLRYLNHSCQPNCEIWDNDRTTLLLVAKRNIQPGEELTVDYGYEEIYQSCSCSHCS